MSQFLSFRPSFGKAITENLVLSSSIGINYSNAKSNSQYTSYNSFYKTLNSQKSSLLSYSFGLGIRKYIPISNKLLFNIALTFSGNKMKSNSNYLSKTYNIEGGNKVNSDSNITKHYYAKIEPQIGVTYMLSNLISLNSYFYYELITFEDNSKDNIIRKDFGLRVGLTYFLNNGNNSSED